MSQTIRSSSPRKSTKLIGEILTEAGLISEEQVERALRVQQECFKLKIGEIFAIKGWLKQETVDFFVSVCKENKPVTYSHHKPIGYYFKKAGLLTEEQINSILNDQKKLGIKFCYLAVMKGFLPEKTANFFLDNISTNHQKNLPNSMTDSSQDNSINQKNEPREITLFEVITGEFDRSEIYVEMGESYTIGDIEYSPIWIDV